MSQPQPLASQVCFDMSLLWDLLLLFNDRLAASYVDQSPCAVLSFDAPNLQDLSNFWARPDTPQKPRTHFSHSGSCRGTSAPPDPSAANPQPANSAFNCPLNACAERMSTPTICLIYRSKTLNPEPLLQDTRAVSVLIGSKKL